MAKLIILSVVLVSFIVPIRLATKVQPARAVRRTQGMVFLFILIWALLCLHWYPALVPLE